MYMFFFFKQKTAYEMRISDWSSDVCSSDLALLRAELEVEDGVSPRVSPLADVRDLGGLLQRAGFALPVVDVDSLTVTYPSALALMRDLRGMGETATDRNRRRGLTRRSEEHTSELQSLMRSSYAVFCLKKKTNT